MHSWGDGFKYFDDVGEAADFIGDYLRKWGRVGVRQTKEKYGTVRVYCSLGWSNLHDLLWPGYVYNQWKSPWLWKLEVYFWPKVFHRTGLGYLSYVYHKLLYRRAYKLAVKRWPHIRKEILNGADYRELLRGL